MIVLVKDGLPESKKNAESTQGHASNWFQGFWNFREPRIGLGANPLKQLRVNFTKNPPIIYELSKVYS